MEATAQPFAASVFPLMCFFLAEPVRAFEHAARQTRTLPCTIVVGPCDHRVADVWRVGHLKHFAVVFQPLKDGKASGNYVIFADGFAGPGKPTGKATFRPTGLAVGPDGAVYLVRAGAGSNGGDGVIYKVPADGSTPTVVATDPQPNGPAILSVDAGADDALGYGGPIAVSSDGLLMAMSAIRDRANAERLAAVVSGLTSLAGGASTWYQMGAINRVIIDMAEGYLLVTAISSGSVLGVMADRTANLSTLAYEMTLFANRAGSALTPQLINELKNSLES